MATVRFNHLHSSLVEASLSGDTCNARRASLDLESGAPSISIETVNHSYRAESCSIDIPEMRTDGRMDCRHPDDGRKLFAII